MAPTIQHTATQQTTCCHWLQTGLTNILLCGGRYISHRGGSQFLSFHPVSAVTWGCLANLPTRSPLSNTHVHIHIQAPCLLLAPTQLSPCLLKCQGFQQLAQFASKASSSILHRTDSETLALPLNLTVASNPNLYFSLPNSLKLITASRCDAA